MKNWFSFQIFMLLLLMNTSVYPQCWQDFYGDAGLRTDGTLWFTGNQGQLYQYYPPDTWLYFEGSNNSWIGITSDGTLKVRQAGDPILSFGSGWVKASEGGNFFLAIKSDGTLWGYGYNSYGQLGIGNTAIQYSLVQVGTESSWQSVSVSRQGYTLAIKTDGTLWGWGYNQEGGLGDGTTTNKLTPVQIGSSADWQSVSASRKHAAGIKTNGTLWEWGFLLNSIPTQIGADSDWAIVKAGTYTFQPTHSPPVYQIKTNLIKQNGTLWGLHGQGISDIYTNFAFPAINAQQPIQLGNDNTWISVQTLGSKTVAVKSDFTAWKISTQLAWDATTQIMCPLPLSLNDFEVSGLNTYPNPANDVIYIDHTYFNVEQITITDLTGKVIAEHLGNHSSINISGYASGIYIIKIAADGNIYQNKFIKQ